MIIENLNIKMVKTVEALQKKLVAVKIGKADPSILDNILVEYYGSSVPINQLANINVLNPQQLVIIPWEKNAIASIEKSIIKANIGITPQKDGTLIRLPIPPLTQERRKDLVRQVKQIIEDAKNSIRRTRRDSNQLIKEQEKNKEISEDALKNLEKKSQKITDEYIKKIDSLLEKKNKDLTEF